MPGGMLTNMADERMTIIGRINTNIEISPVR